MVSTYDSTVLCGKIVICLVVCAIFPLQTYSQPQPITFNAIIISADQQLFIDTDGDCFKDATEIYYPENQGQTPCIARIFQDVDSDGPWDMTTNEPDPDDVQFEVCTNPDGFNCVNFVNIEFNGPTIGLLEGQFGTDPEFHCLMGCWGPYLYYIRAYLACNGDVQERVIWYSDVFELQPGLQEIYLGPNQNQYHWHCVELNDCQIVAHP